MTDFGTRQTVFLVQRARKFLLSLSLGFCRVPSEGNNTNEVKGTTFPPFLSPRGIYLILDNICKMLRMLPSTQ